MEEWRDIPSLPGYRASSSGKILGRSGRVLSLKTCKRGYKWFGVANGKGGSNNVSVARAVCEAFNGPPPENAHVDHINRVRDENHPSNLRWVSRSENLRNRQCAHGSEHSHAKLTDELVRKIRSADHYRGFDREFARTHNVSRETVRDARNGKQWRHIQ